jgi:ABC-type branched-subunit amino acid transport system ATPase component
LVSALAIRQLEVSYGRVPILFRVDLDVPAGALTALVGTNGAGKSTLLRAAAALLRPDRGTVHLFGDDITRLPTDERVERGMIMVAGGRSTYPSLTVDESLRMATFSFRRDRSRVAAALSTAFAHFPFLEQRRGQLAGTLSGGEQHLLALAGALAAGPRVLLVDELTLGLSGAAVDDVLGQVAQLPASGVTVLLVEQSIRRALAVADTAVFLERGEVRFAGPAAELASRHDLLRPVLLPPPP